MVFYLLFQEFKSSFLFFKKKKKRSDRKSNRIKRMAKFTHKKHFAA